MSESRVCLRVDITFVCLRFCGSEVDMAGCWRDMQLASGRGWQMSHELLNCCLLLFLSRSVRSYSAVFACSGQAQSDSVGSVGSVGSGWWLVCLCQTTQPHQSSTITKPSRKIERSKRQEPAEKMIKKNAEKKTQREKKTRQNRRNGHKRQDKAERRSSFNTTTKNPSQRLSRRRECDKMISAESL